MTYIKEYYEIDFRCKDTLFQVSYKMDDEKTRNRELRVFESFDESKKYNHKIVTYDETNVTNGVEIINFEDFAFGINKPY